jgi:hypothetical protein
MLVLPPVSPVLGRRQLVRLPRDHYVRVDANDYSVHPSAVGRRVEVVADLTCVQVLCAGRLVAAHQRCWAAHQTITDPDHVSAAAQLRTAHRAAQRQSASPEVEQRRLSDYDAAFGIDAVVA